jgi:HK97 family phage portal protein
MVRVLEGIVPLLARAAVDLAVMDFSMATLLRGQAEGKALGPNPAFMDPRPVGVTDLNLGRIPGQSPSVASSGKRLSQRRAETHLSAYGGDQAMDWVMDCVRFYADTVANADFHFEKPKKLTEINDPAEPSEPVAPPAGLATLFENPNPYQDYIELMELLVIDLLLVGNSYWLKWRTNEKGQPLALYRLAPPYVEIDTTPWGPGGYIYQIPNAEKLAFDAEDVIHLRLANPDPKNPYFGLGIIQGAGRAADLDLSLTDSQASYFDHRALPSVAVESDRRVPKDVFNKMRKQLRARAAGPKNAGELLVLESGLKLSSIAPNAGDAGFAPLSKMSRDRIFALFRLHPKMLGIADETGNETVAEAQKQWDTKTARPFMNKVQRKITMELVELWTLAYKIDYEAEMTPEEQAQHAGMVGEIPGVEVDEVRKAGKLGAHKDSEIGSTTLNLPGEEAGTGAPGDPTRNGHPDRGLPGEAGRPPNPENTRAFPRGTNKLPRTAKARKSAGKAIDVDDALSRLDALIAEQKSVPSPETVDDPLRGKREPAVDASTAEFRGELAKAARVLERDLLDKAEGKAVSDVVSKLRNAEGWKEFEAIATKAYEQALLKVMSAAAIHHDELGLKPAGEVNYEQLIDALVKRSDSGVKAITATLKDRVSAAAKGARANKEDITAAIQQVVSDWVEGQAHTVALTEATRGYNETTLDVAEKAGSTHVLVSDGDEDDQPCIEANGQTWTIEKARANIMQHPRCRRAFIPIT